jgi:NAD(P)-dependent dehydrogenase (short-subunit alcohol dehydrogenase family)
MAHDVNTPQGRDAQPRIVVVTGGNRGIGRELVRQLAARGDTVVLGTRSMDKGEQTARELTTERLPGEILVRQLDVADHESADRLAGELDQKFGRIDGLINNAAIHYDSWQAGTSADLVTVEEALQTNLIGAWRTALALLNLLWAAPTGRIVNVSSQAGSLAGMGGGTPAYRVSKAALNALTRILAAELRHTGILVNAVCPGWVATDMGGPGGRPVAEGAASVLWALDLPPDGPTGGFFRDGRPLPW